MSDTALSARLRDFNLAGRHLTNKLRGAFARVVMGWERLSPATYKPAQKVYHLFRPGLREEALPPYGTVLDIDGIKIKLDEHLSPLQVRKLARGRHTRHERELILGELRPDDIVMELGGGIGMLSASIALKIGGEHVHSYEANPTLEPLIRENYRLNNVEPHLKMCMLGREVGQRTFHVSRHFSRSNAYQGGEESRPYTVPVEPLNDELARVKPTVLIFDIQGGEGELLEFADLSSVRLLLVEMHPDILGVGRVNRMRRDLREGGFQEIRQVGQSFLYRRDR